MINPDAGGWGAFVALTIGLVTAIARGWLVPKRTVDELTRAAKRVEEVQSARLEDWRETSLLERKRGDLQAEQIGDLLELARVWDPLIRAATQRREGNSP